MISKLNEIMCWRGDGTPDEIFSMNGGSLNVIPCKEAIEVISAGDLQTWAEQQRPKSEAELFNSLMKVIRKTTSCPVFNDKKRINAFPPLANFFIMCQNMERRGKAVKEAKAISELAWISVICREKTAENCERFFKNPNKEKYLQAVERIKNVWGMKPKDIDALRYFVCQTRHEGHNPSLNKSIYFWGTEKQTGKTSVARALVTVLNGDKFGNFGTYESTLSTEMQYNDHDVPSASKFNAVLLDESMPKDSRKSYGLIKQVLTSSSCKYNQKFGAITRIPCKRFYICTSNEDIGEFVQDWSERRFYAIKFEKKPKQIPFTEIYDIWFEFATNAEPDTQWQTWYDTFDFVEGIEQAEVKELINEMQHRKTELFNVELLTGGYSTTVKAIANKIYKNEPTREQKKTVRLAFELIFAECAPPTNKSMFNIAKCRAVLDTMDENQGEINTKLPF